MVLVSWHSLASEVTFPRLECKNCQQTDATGRPTKAPLSLHMSEEPAPSSYRCCVVRFAEDCPVVGPLTYFSFPWPLEHSTLVVVSIAGAKISFLGAWRPAGKLVQLASARLSSARVIKNCGTHYRYTDCARTETRLQTNRTDRLTLPRATTTQRQSLSAGSIAIH